MTAHQAWLEEPYQRRYAENDALTAIEESFDALFDCEECGEEVVPFAVEASNLTTWRQGGYAGCSYELALTCPICKEVTTRSMEEDNL